MNAFSKTYETIWADMDPNRHLRHSVYNDYAAHTRVALFAEQGLSIGRVAELGLGPILFREETRFLKEVPMSDALTVHCRLQALRKDANRWTFRHDLYRGDGNKAAVVTVDGAWLNLETRKLGTATGELIDVMQRFPRSEDFVWLRADG